MKTCKACGGILGKDCFNESDCMSISINRDQHINQLQSELHWERGVVIPDLEDKLSDSLSILYDLARILNTLSIEQDQAYIVEQAFEFHNHNIGYKKPEVKIETNPDDLPF